LNIFDVFDKNIGGFIVEKYT